MAERRAQRRMTSCLVTALVPITEAARAGSNPNAANALYSLGEEIGAQYQSMALGPILDPALTGIRRLLALPLPLPAALRSTLRSYLKGIAVWDGLNVCTDADAWFARGLDAANVPRGTLQTTVVLAEMGKLVGVTGSVQNVDLTAAEREALKLEGDRVNKHLSALILAADKRFKSWIEQVEQRIDSAIPTTTTTTTTTTSTTGTQTTTTGTQTTP